MKKYQNEKEFLKKIATKTLNPNLSSANQTGWKNYNGNYIHYVNGGYENDPELGVCMVTYDSMGNLLEEQSRVDGLPHKEDGPARVWYTSGGVVRQEEYHLYGTKYTKEKYEERLKSIKQKYLDFEAESGKILKINQSLIKKYFNHAVEVDDNGNIINFKNFNKNVHSNGNDKNELLVVYHSDRDGIVLTTTPSKVVLGPAQATINNDSISHIRYLFPGNQSLKNEPEWKSFVGKYEKGLPNWVRYSQLEQFGFDVKTTEVKELNPNEEVELAKSFFKDKSKLATCYKNKKNQLVVVFKEPVGNVFYEKLIPLDVNFRHENSSSYIDTSFEDSPDTYKSAEFSFAPNGEVNINNVAAIDKEMFAKKLNLVLNNQKQQDEIVEEIEKKLKTEEDNKKPEVVYKEVKLQDYKGLSDLLENQSNLLKKIIELQKDAIEFRNKELMLSEFNKSSKPAVDTEIAIEKPKQTTNVVNVAAVKVESKAVQIIKSDAKEVAKRIAVSKITTLISEIIGKLLTSKAKGKTKEEIQAFLKSEKGKAVVSVATGMLLPLINNKLPEKYKPIIDEMSVEFRISGETEIASQLADFVAGPLFASVTSALSTVELFTENNAEKVRVDAGGSAGERNSPAAELFENEQDFINANNSNKVLN